MTSHYCEELATIYKNIARFWTKEMYKFKIRWDKIYSSYLILEHQMYKFKLHSYFLGCIALRHDDEWWRLKPIAIPANSIHAPWTKAWTSGQSSGGPSSFVWTEGQFVTQDIDLSRDGSHLALDVKDLQLHRYDGATDLMGAFCEISKTWTVIYGSSFIDRIQFNPSMDNRTPSKVCEESIYQSCNRWSLGLDK